MKRKRKWFLSMYPSLFLLFRNKHFFLFNTMITQQILFGIMNLGEYIKTTPTCVAHWLLLWGLFAIVCVYIYDYAARAFHDKQTRGKSDFTQWDNMYKVKYYPALVNLQADSLINFPGHITFRKRDRREIFISILH